MLEEDAAAQSEKAKKAVYKKMDHDMHMRRRLAGQPPTAQGRADLAGGLERGGS